jgi:hypothetical protein
MTEENEDRLSRVETLLNRAVTESDGHMQTIVALIPETNARMDSGFDGVDRRFDKVDLNLKLGEIEDKVDGVIGVVSNWKREPPQGGA